MHNAGQRPYHKRGIPLARVSKLRGLFPKRSPPNASRRTARLARASATHLLPHKRNSQTSIEGKNLQTVRAKSPLFLAILEIRSGS